MEDEYIVWQRGEGGGNYHPPPLQSPAKTMTAIMISVRLADWFCFWLCWLNFLTAWTTSICLKPQFGYIISTICHLIQTGIGSRMLQSGINLWVWQKCLYGCGSHTGEPVLFWNSFHHVQVLPAFVFLFDCSSCAVGLFDLSNIKI